MEWAYSLRLEVKKAKRMSLRTELLVNDLDCVGPEQLPEQCGPLADAVKATGPLQTAGIISLAAGGALVAGAFITYLVWPDAEPKTQDSVARPKVRPTVLSLGQEEMILGLSGAF